MPWAASWPTTRAGWLHPQETRLLEAHLGKAPFPIGVPLGQPWEGLAERVQCLGFSGCKMAVTSGGYSWRLVCQETHPFIVPLQGIQVQRLGRDLAAVAFKRCAPW